MIGDIMVIIRLKAFSIFSDILGQENILKLEDKTSVKQLVEYLKRNNKQFENMIKQVPAIVLVNGRLVSQEYELKNNDEVAIIPPASGG